MSVNRLTPACEAPHPVGSILILCTHNAVRSPMLAAFLRKSLDPHIFIESAGIRAGLPNLLAAEVMAEMGFDMRDHVPRDYADLEETSYDLLIALCPEAYESARTIAARQRGAIEFWEMSEPPLLTEISRTQALEAFRQIRNDLVRHAENRFGITIGAQDVGRIL